MVQRDQFPRATEDGSPGRSFERIGLVVKESVIQDVEEAIVRGCPLLFSTLWILDDADWRSDQDFGGRLDERDHPQVRCRLPVDRASVQRDDAKVEPLVRQEEGR